MDSRQLQYFIAVAKEKSIIKAANYLPLTPSAIAKQIISLEEELGTALFERQPRGVKLTLAGEVWLEHAHQLLDEIEQASRDVHRVSQSILPRRLDIAIPNLIWTSLPPLERILSDFSRNNPGVEIITHHIPSRQRQLEALREGIILAAFNNAFREAPDLAIEIFAQHGVSLVASTKHPLANCGSVPLEKLREYPLISFQEQPFQNSVETAFKIHNVSPRIAHKSSDTFSHLGMCACNMGISLLNNGLQRLRFPGVKFIPLLSDFPLTARFDCISLKKQSSPLLKALIKSIQSCRDDNSTLNKPRFP